MAASLRRRAASCRALRRCTKRKYWYAQGLAEFHFGDERGRRRVPGGIAAGLEGGADAAGGKRRRVGLALDELAAGEFFEHLVLAVDADETVVLFGGEPGHGLEPVRVGGGAFFHGPFLHGVGDLVGLLPGNDRALVLPFLNALNVFSLKTFFIVSSLNVLLRSNWTPWQNYRACKVESNRFSG